jgi:hypothetical protein
MLLSLNPDLFWAANLQETFADPQKNFAAGSSSRRNIFCTYLQLVAFDKDVITTN